MLQGFGFVGITKGNWVTRVTETVTVKVIPGRMYVESSGVGFNFKDRMRELCMVDACENHVGPINVGANANVSRGCARRNPRDDG